MSKIWQPFPPEPNRKSKDIWKISPLIYFVLFLGQLWFCWLLYQLQQNENSMYRHGVRWYMMLRQEWEPHLIPNLWCKSLPSWLIKWCSVFSTALENQGRETKTSSRQKNQKSNRHNQRFIKHNLEKGDWLENQDFFGLFFLCLIKIEKKKKDTTPCCKYHEAHCEKLICSYGHWERKSDLNLGRKF